MNYIIAIIIIAFYLFSLRANYRLDKGEHRIAKIINPIVVFALFYVFFNNAYDKILWIVPMEQDSISELYASTKSLPAPIVIGTWILDLIVSIWIVFLTWTMIFGRNLSRKRFLYTIPLICLLNCMELYQSIITQYDLPGYQTIIGLVLLICIWSGLMILYSRKFMIKFFERRLLSQA